MNAQESKEILAEAQTEDEWNAKVNEIKAANGGYPGWWYPEIVASGFVSSIASRWGDDGQIKTVAL